MKVKELMEILANADQEAEVVVERSCNNGVEIIIYPSGSINYRLNGIVHREDGPAVIYPDGSIFYYVNGKLHREDGPAIIYPDGRQSWYLNGEFIKWN